MVTVALLEGKQKGPCGFGGVLSKIDVSLIGIDLLPGCGKARTGARSLQRGARSSPRFSFDVGCDVNKHFAGQEAASAGKGEDQAVRDVGSLQLCVTLSS